MTRLDDIRPARQARSKASLQRLLRAALEVLRKQGLEGATIPRIASAARLSPGNVYRRFPDKDALLREVFLRYFEHNNEELLKFANPARWKRRPLAAIVQALIAEMIKAYRKNAHLLRAVGQFAKRHADASFRRRAQALQLQSYEQMMRLFLSRQREIGHPDPAYAIRFGTMMISFAAQHFVLALGAKPDVAASLGFSDESLERELTRAFLSYLQVKS